MITCDQPATKIGRAHVQQVARALPKLLDAWSCHLLSSRMPESLTLTQLEGPLFQNWLDAAAKDEKGTDDKLSAAYLCGRIGWSLAELFCGLALRGVFVASVDLNAIWLAARRVDWEIEDETGTGQVFDVGVDFELLAFETDSAGFQTALEAILDPIVVAISNATSLSRSALWRIMGDNVSQAFLSHGKAIKNPEAGMKLAKPILAAHGTKLFSKQTTFAQITVPERPEISEWFRMRGGCCRYYTTEGGDYCSSCVLRDAKSHKDMLITYLRDLHAS